MGINSIMGLRSVGINRFVRLTGVGIKSTCIVGLTGVAIKYHGFDRCRTYHLSYAIRFSHSGCV